MLKLPEDSYISVSLVLSELPCLAQAKTCFGLSNDSGVWEAELGSELRRLDAEAGGGGAGGKGFGKGRMYLNYPRLSKE